VEKVCSRAVILSRGRLVAERLLKGAEGPECESLEDLFVRVTEQRDFAPVARDILAVITQ
jgi:hypothetical protein